MSQFKKMMSLYNNRYDIVREINDSLDNPDNFRDLIDDIYKTLDYGASRYDTAFLACNIENLFMGFFRRNMIRLQHLPLLDYWQRQYGIMDRSILKSCDPFISDIKKDLHNYKNSSDIMVERGNAIFLYLENFSIDRKSKVYVQDHFLYSDFFDLVHRNFNAYELHEMLSLYAYDKSLFSNKSHNIDYLLGVSLLNKNTSIKKGDIHIKDGQRKGIIPPDFDIYEEVASVIDDLSWIHVNDTTVMKTLIDKKWNADLLAKKGFDINNLMEELIKSHEDKRKSKQNKSYFMVLTSKLRSSMSPDLVNRCDAIVGQILSGTRHPISKDKDTIVREAMYFLKSDTTSPEMKMACQLHLVQNKVEDIKLDRFELDDKSIRKIISDVLPVATRDHHFKFEHDIYTDLGVYTSTKKATARQKKVMLYNIESDFGL